MTIKTASGNEFDFDSFFYNGGTVALTVIGQIEGFRDGVSTGVQTSGLSVSLLNPTRTISLDDTIFDNVDTVVINYGLIDVGALTAYDDFVFQTVPDTNPPEVQSINLLGTPAADATSVDYQVTFDEAASNISADDFELTTTGTTSGTIAATPTSGTSVTVSVTSINGEGTLRLDMLGNTDIVDASGNGNGTNGYVPAFTAGDVHTVDQTAPAGYSATLDQDPITAANETAASFSFAGAEVGADYAFTISSSGGGANVTGSGTVSAANEQVTGLDLGGLGDGTITLTVTLTDATGIAGTPATDTATKDTSVPPSPGDLFDDARDDITVMIAEETGRRLQADMGANTSILQGARDRFIEDREKDRACLFPENQPPDDDFGRPIVRGSIPFDVDGVARVEGSTISTSGSFIAADAAGAGGVQRLMFGDFHIVRDEDGSTTGQGSARLAWERTAGADAVLGWHLGADATRSDISGAFGGDATGQGVSVGSYFASALYDNVFLSAIGTLGYRWSDLDVSDGTLALDGRYSGGWGAMEVALSGKRQFDGFELRPEVRLAYGQAASGAIDFDATAFGMTEAVTHPGVNVSSLELSVAPEFRFPSLLQGNSNGSWSITPSLTCARIDEVTTQNRCGGGVRFGAQERWDDGRTMLDVGAKWQTTAGRKHLGLSLQIERAF